VPATLGESPLSLRDLPTLAAHAELSGLDRVGVNDHLLHPSPCWDPVACLGAIAVATRRVSLATQVLILPLRHPLQVAQSFATLDALSGGRVELGVGLGGEWPSEYEAVGVDLHRRGRLADEALARILECWSQDGIEGSPRPYRLSGRPVQVPHPPIVVGGRSRQSVRRAARFGDRWDGIFLDPAQLRSRASLLAEASAGEGRSVGAGLVAWARVGPEGEARAELARSLEPFYGMPFSQLERFCVLGPPERCEEHVSELVSSGASHLTLIPAGRDPAGQIESLGELARRLRRPPARAGTAGAVGSDPTKESDLVGTSPAGPTAAAEEVEGR
jgi:alkanesulfonate monooxygenase SsuD/methylene tetrahydromethanopterin reductase-like flavin-dependent oxidoreductase (luciferase family)